MIHWGVELDARPRAYQVQQAHRMIDAGADVIFGSHPHALQPMETYRGRPIFYSLGNLVWPRVTSTTSATAVAEVVVAPDGSISGRLIPAEIVSDGHPVLITPPQDRPTSDARLQAAGPVMAPGDPDASLIRGCRARTSAKRWKSPGSAW